MIFIGIDFSINSTAMCILDGDKEEFFYSFNRGQTPQKYLKVLEKYPNIYTIGLEKIIDLEDLSTNELIKIDEAIKLADLIVNEVNKYDSVLIGIENFSYNGIGKRSLDLAGFQYILRARLFKKENVKNIFFYTPGEIKKYASKGNAVKEQMMESYLKLNQENDLTRLMKDEEIQKASKFPKPIDDLVDSWYIVKMLQKKYQE